MNQFASIGPGQGYSGGTGMIGSPLQHGVSTTPSTIPSETTRVLELIEVLDKAIDGLSQKLCVVMAPDPPVACSAAPANIAPTRSDMLFRLEGASGRLNGCITRIGSITNRIEL